MGHDLAGRFEGAPYSRSLGIRVESADAERVRLRVPYKDENSNPGQALHGGVSASTIGAAGTLAAWMGGSGAPGIERGTLDLSVCYLAAAIGEDIVATAEVLRRGKELVYSSVDVRNDAGKRIATGLVTYRLFDPASEPQAAERQRQSRREASAEAIDVPDRAKVFVSTPFIARMGMAIGKASGGEARLEMDRSEDKLDADGNLHEGAIAAFVDTAGALASWSVTGFDFRYKASTVGIHVSYHAPLREDAVAEAKTLRRNNEILLSQVTVSGKTSGLVVATGSVTYRIVV